jgi:hypothetical protein
MYSPKIVQESQDRIEREMGWKLKRYEPEQSWGVSASLDAQRRAVLDGGSFSPDRQRFVDNEMLLCKIDFRYFARYINIDLDGGGAGPLKLQESQDIALSRYFAPAEERMWEAVARKEPVDGLLFLWNKARQIYATTLVRAMTFHRLIFTADIKAMVAPAEDQQINPMYERDAKLLAGIPWWMRPSTNDPDNGGYNAKDEHISFAGAPGRAPLHSYLRYYSGTTKGGIGQSVQYQLQHITETAFWPDPFKQLDYILDPACPQSIHTLNVRESTSDGRGDWWHYNTEAARKHETKWGYIFMPWYVVSNKRRRMPPPDWSPDTLTFQHADLVIKTSPEWLGKTVTLDRQQLYWWETERKEHQKKGALGTFYTNYPATPEESFQHSGNMAFTAEQIEGWRLKCSIPDGLEVVNRA